MLGTASQVPTRQRNHNGYLLRWDGDHYVPHQPLLERAARAFATFARQGHHHLLVAGLEDPPRLLRWDGGRFEPLQQLEGLGARLPSQLSGGQRQRVALARTLAVEPRILLLDEPFGALDRQVREELRTELRRLHDTLGMTTVFVTHDQEEALALADRAVVLARGQIVDELAGSGGA